MNDFVVFYSGACFESGDSPEQVERKIQDKMALLGKVLDIEAEALRPDDRKFGEGNYVVSFEGEITLQAETKEQAENKVYDMLAHLGQITVVAFENVKAGM